VSGPLTALLELAARRCDAAAQAVAAEFAAQRACVMKGQMLAQYRAEYVTRQSATARNGTDGATLRNLAGFLARLDEASQQNARENAESAARVASAQAAWNEARRTLEGYQALGRRNEQRAAVKARRTEQRQQDEFAARSSIRMSISTGEQQK